MFVNVAADKADRLCEVTIQEPTENKADGMQFSFFFQSNSSVRLKKLHDITDLGLILPSCNTVQQFAQLVSKEDKDKEALETLTKYMFLRKKVGDSANDIYVTDMAPGHLFNPIVFERA